MKKRELYIFIFVGEFGYELINWQGKVRKFVEFNPDALVAISGKNACEVLYRDFSDIYIALDECRAYKHSFADRYFAHAKNYRYKGKISDLIDEIWAVKFRLLVKKFLIKELRKKVEPNFRPFFVFSDLPKNIDGLTFGAPRSFFSRLFCSKPQDIYLNAPIQENSYRDIAENLRAHEISHVEVFSQSMRPRAIIQTASRNRINRVQNFLDEEVFLNEIAKYWEVYLLEYESTRNSDTQGTFKLDSFQKIRVKTLAEQISYLSKADVCISFTHGDFRSNTYVPALAGLKSFVITDKETLKNSDIKLWNESVFAGEIIPITLENPELVVLEIKRIQNSSF